jgi:hypothetical protein
MVRSAKYGLIRHRATVKVVVIRCAGFRTVKKDEVLTMVTPFANSCTAEAIAMADLMSRQRGVEGRRRCDLRLPGAQCVDVCRQLVSLFVGQVARVEGLQGGSQNGED